MVIGGEKYLLIINKWVTDFPVGRGSKRIDFAARYYFMVFDLLIVVLCPDVCRYGT